MPAKDTRHSIIGGKHRAAARYAMMVNRCKALTKKNTHYVGVEVRMSREDFIPWFQARDFKGASVDRIERTGHYEISNLQVIPLAKNIAKDKLIGDDQHSTCFDCKETKMANQFARDKRRARGFSTMCKACDNKRRRRPSTGTS